MSSRERKCEERAAQGLACRGRRLGQEVDERSDEGLYVAVCDRCGATHVVEVDFIGLGLDFLCRQVGAQCDGGAAPSAAAAPLPLSAPKPGLGGLTAEEKRGLFERYEMQQHAERAPAKDSRTHVDASMSAALRPAPSRSHYAFASLE